MPVLKNVKVSWASVQKPNIQFEPCWEIKVHLNKEQASKLQAEAKALNPKGIKIKQEGDEFTFRFKRKVEKADGTENKAPVVCGPGGIDDKFTRLIGNGSICNVQYLLIAYDNKKFGKGITTDLKGVQVLEHVPYGEADGEAFGSANDKPIESNSYDDGDFN
jgi:hypothetical protein